MDDEIKRFRMQHECKYCLYYMTICKAKKNCVFDYLPLDSPEEDILLFIIE
ncbi:MAG: hypothetical protein IKN47_00735 [Lachnospiraceae bacterium]|nr:hypothetical protein [Lachnospiraceae bacterium]